MTLKNVYSISISSTSWYPKVPCFIEAFCHIKNLTQTKFELKTCFHSIFTLSLYFTGKDILFHMNELGRKPPMFEEASFIAEQVLDSGYEFETGEMMFNKFK